MSGCRSLSIFVGVWNGKRPNVLSEPKALSEPMVAAYQTIHMDAPDCISSRACEWSYSFAGS